MMNRPNVLLVTLWSLSLLPWTVLSFQTTFHNRQPSLAKLASAPQHQRVSTPALFLSASDDDDDIGSVTRMSIEYCTGCRWMLKSFWMAQELLTTFEEELDAITIIPSSETTGIFQVKLSQATTLGPETSKRKVLWDRKTKGGFPSPKVLKQLVRDIVTPAKYLGHSDTAERQQEEKGGESSSSTTTTSSTTSVEKEEEQEGPWPWAPTPTPTVTITYCTGCKWLMRAAYFGQELLTTFGNGEVKSVTLLPSKPPALGGQFSVTLDGELVFDRATEGRFPEVKEIKQLIRDKVAPAKDLGHSDVAVAEIEHEDE